jgi:hypothetical protein
MFLVLNIFYDCEFGTGIGKSDGGEAILKENFSRPGKGFAKFVEVLMKYACCVGSRPKERVPPRVSSSFLNFR